MRVKLLIREVNITAQNNLSAYLQPTLFRPNSVQSSVESELLIFMLIKVFCGFSEHIPACTCLRGVIANISIRQLDAKHCISIARLWRKSRTVRHGYPVYFLRDNLKAFSGLLFSCNGFGLVIVFYFKLFAGACKHTRLEDDSHIFTFNQIIFKVQIIWNRAINKIIKILFCINYNNAFNRSFPAGINFRAIQAIFMRSC